MITIDANNITVDFLNKDLVHVSLEQDGHLSKQLIRELRAISKINNGEVVKNCIVSNHQNLGQETDWCRICKKVDHMRESMSVAVVCNNACALATNLSKADISKNASPKIFHSYSDAIDWIDQLKTI